MVLIIDDLLRLTIDLGMKLLAEISNMVDEQMLKTQESVQKKFIEIQMRYENGEISENEYKETAGFLENRLRKMRGEQNEDK